MKIIYFLSLIIFLSVSVSCFSQNVGIGTTTPSVKFHVVNGTTGPMGHPYETAVIESNNDHKFGVYTTSTNTQSDGSSIILGYSNFKTQNLIYPGFEIQHGMYPDQNSHYLRFNGLERNDAGGITSGSYTNVVVMDNNGHVGINLGKANPPPYLTANLHVKGTVRFQGLPTGGGNYLVVDGNGNVFQSSNAINTSPAVNQTTVDDINSLRNEVADLKDQVNQLLQILKQKNISVTEK